VAIQEEWGRPTGLLQSLWGTAVRILLASADSSILIRCPNSMSLLFCMIEVWRGCWVRRRTSQLETWWYQRISRILLRHHWSRASIFLFWNIQPITNHISDRENTARHWWVAYLNLAVKRTSGQTETSGNFKLLTNINKQTHTWYINTCNC